MFPRGGGSFDIPVSFGLCIEGELINIEVIKVTEGNLYDSNLKIHWIIKKIIIPEKLFGLGYIDEEIEKIIKDAFIGLGTTGVNYTETSDVTVEMKQHQ